MPISTTIATRIIPCKLCGNHISDPDFQVYLYQDDFPDINIGPYCEGCLSKVKICHGCHHDFPADSCKRAGDGSFYCASCSASFTSCHCCGNIVSGASTATNYRDSEGNVLCNRCFTSKYFTCNCCGGVKNKDVLFDKTSIEGLQRAGVFRKYPNICKTCFEVKHRAFKLYEVKVCTHCERAYREGDGNDKYCDRCLDGFSYCDICNERHPNVSSYRYAYIDANGNYQTSVKRMCRTCKSRDYEVCSGCTYLAEKGTLKVSPHSKGKKVCPSCQNSKVCKSCLSFTNGRDIHSSGVCNECFNTYYNEDLKCDNCGRVKDFQGYCRVCQRTVVYNYSTKPRLYHNMAEKEIIEDNIFFGFENEVSYGSGDTYKSEGLKNLYMHYDPSVVLAKSDGSIDGYGYEIVSQPMTIKYFNELNLDAMFHKKMKKSDSCGLHIHVSRASFLSDVHLYKVINFLKDNKDFTIKMAGRNYNGYSTEVADKATRYIKKSKSGGTERRCSVNLTNKNTVEFRLFAGCIDVKTFRGRVEFLHALVSWTKDAGISQINLKNFMSYLEEKQHTYPNAFEAAKSN